MSLLYRRTTNDVGVETRSIADEEDETERVEWREGALGNVFVS